MEAIVQNIAAANVAAFRAMETAEQDLSAKRQAFANGLAKALVPGMSYDAYSAYALEWRKAYGASPEASQKAWERAIKAMNAYLRSKDSVEFTIPKSDNAKAQQMAAKREAAKAADQKALEVIAKAKGLALETAKPDQLLQLAADPKLTTANKKILVDAAIKREKEEKREAEKAGNEADKALREEAREILKGFHGAQLAKALAALKKIK